MENFVILIYLEIFDASFDASNCEWYITITSIAERKLTVVITMKLLYITTY